MTNKTHSKTGDFWLYTFFIADINRSGAVVIAMRDNIAKITNNSVIPISPPLTFHPVSVLLFYPKSKTCSRSQPPPSKKPTTDHKEMSHKRYKIKRPSGSEQK
ncbi:hypothetical protein [Methanolapillus africanus]|uniref:hypothetical protein n=1 Tax=Methanolapillus africanus TaxID=3028297 RepID=UPI0030B8A39D